MKYEIEIIKNRNDIGLFEIFTTYREAKKQAIKLSKLQGIIEISLKSICEDDKDELHEYYKNGKLNIKLI